MYDVNIIIAGVEGKDSEVYAYTVNYRTSVEEGKLTEFLEHLSEAPGLVHMKRLTEES